MKKNVLAVLLLFGLLSFAQKKKTVVKRPSFKITYDKFENKYSYNAESGNIGIYATGTSNDFTDITYKAFTLTVYDSYLTHASGITLLFSDGTKMNFETKEELGSNFSKGLWQYYVFAYPTAEQWLELSNKIIVSYKFHIFERNYKNGILFKKLVNNFYTQE
jgi:hypothetical protein